MQKLPKPGVCFERVAGAPLQIGEHVTIQSRIDDDTFDARFEHREGTVAGLVYDSPEQQFPHQPMVLVRVYGLGEDVFFVEELRLAERRHLAIVRTQTR